MEKEYCIVTLVKLKIWRFWFSQIVPQVFTFKATDDKEALEFFQFSIQKIKAEGKKDMYSDDGEFLASGLFDPASNEISTFKASEIFP